MTQIGDQIPLLDQGFIELQNLLPHPASGVSGDQVIVNAARVSFLGESKGAVQDKKLLHYLYTHHHTSPFEQVVFTFRIKAPLVTWWQLVRHRTARLNLQSGRYTPFAEDEFYVPTEWRRQSARNKQASDGVFDEDTNLYLTAVLSEIYALAYAKYEDALELGVAREQARLFLPGFAAYYTGVWQIDAHNLMHFLRLRSAADAQYEIRVYAEAIDTHFFTPFLPWTAEIFHT